MAEAQIEIAAGDYRLLAAPARGGSILALEWRGQDVLRRAEGPGILDVACFPLVPYSNRIAGGRLRWRGREVRLAPNFPAADPVNPLHGFGWLCEWDVVDATADSLRLAHRHEGEGWPWPCRAELAYRQGADGLVARLALTNLADEPMPAGQGFHPYFPRDASTRFFGLHRGEWTSEGGLPVSLEWREDAIDWWHGSPVGARPVDTVYAGRRGDLRLDWPERAMSVRIACSPELTHTSVFVPQGAGWFCVEPVSHATDALNRADGAGAMAGLLPGDTLTAEMRLAAEPGS